MVYTFNASSASVLRCEITFGAQCTLTFSLKQEKMGSTHADSLNSAFDFCVSWIDGRLFWTILIFRLFILGWAGPWAILTMCLFRLWGRENQSWIQVKASLFVNFAFEGRLCLNGCDMRVWSVVRPELQKVYVASIEFTHNELPEHDAADTQKLNALQLARSLCESFLEKPVTSVITGDDEEQCMKRIMTAMSTRSEQVADPLKAYLQNNIKLPVVMHDILRVTISQPVS